MFTQFEGYTKAAAITKSDTVNLDAVTNAIWVGGTGAMVVVLEDDSTVTFTGIPAGNTIQIRAKRINSTNTDATNMVALYL